MLVAQQKVVHELRSNVSIIEGLTYFTYKDPKGKDQGINVSNRAKLLVELIQDPDRIKQEREKVLSNLILGTIATYSCNSTLVDL